MSSVEDVTIAMAILGSFTYPGLLEAAKTRVVTNPAEETADDIELFGASPTQLVERRLTAYRGALQKANLAGVSELLRQYSARPEQFSDEYAYALAERYRELTRGALAA